MNGVDRDFVKLESDQNFVAANNTIATGRIGYPAIQISPWYTRHDLHSMNIRVTGNHILVLASLTVSKLTRTTRLRRSRRTSKSITTRSPLRPRAGRTVRVRGTCCSACRLTATQGSTRSPFTTTPSPERPATRSTCGAAGLACHSKTTCMAKAQCQICRCPERFPAARTHGTEGSARRDASAE
jgi:hypothetical protein